MPKNFIRFDKFEQAATTAAAVTVTAEEEKKNNCRYKNALRAKVVDEPLHHTPDAKHFIYSQPVQPFSQSVIRPVSQPAMLQSGGDNLITHTCMQLRTRLSNLMAGRQIKRQQNND